MLKISVAWLKNKSVTRDAWHPSICYYPLEHDNVHNIFIIVIIFFYYLLTRGEIFYFDISRFTFASTIFLIKTVIVTFRRENKKEKKEQKKRESVIFLPHFNTSYSTKLYIERYHHTNILWLINELENVYM